LSICVQSQNAVACWAIADTRVEESHETDIWPINPDRQSRNRVIRVNGRPIRRQ